MPSIERAIQNRLDGEHDYVQTIASIYNNGHKAASIEYLLKGIKGKPLKVALRTLHVRDAIEFMYGKDQATAFQYTIDHHAFR